MATARNWDAARDNRRMRRSLITGEPHTTARANAVRKLNYPPTEKQYAYIRSLCEQLRVPYTAPATRGEASRQIKTLLAKKPK